MIIGAVCARADSEGIPDKNLLQLDGETIMARAIRKAGACDQIEATYISTDIPLELWQASCGPSCRMVGRPQGLRGALISKWKVWQYIAMQCPKAAALVDIDISRPLTTVADIAGTIWTFVDTPDADAVLAVTPAKKSPYQDILELGKDGYLAPSKTQGAYVVARQDRPMTYEHGGVYVVSCDALRSSARDLWDVHAIGYIIPWAHTVSIDDLDDWTIIEALHEVSKVAT